MGLYQVSQRIFHQKRLYYELLLHLCGGRFGCALTIVEDLCARKLLVVGLRRFLLVGRRGLIFGGDCTGD